MAAQVTDESLRAALHALRERAAPLVASSDATHAAGVLYSSADMQLVQLEEQIQPLLNAWLPPTEKPLGFNAGFGKMAVMAAPLAPHLVREAVRRGPAEAVAWLRKVITPQKCKARYIVALRGITISASRELLPGFEVMPLEAAPGGITPAQILQQSGPSAFMFPPTGAAALAMKEFEWLVPMGEPGTAMGEPDEMRELLAILAFVGGSPTVERGWVRLDDPDLQVVALSAYSMSFTQPLRDAPPLDLDSAANLLPHYAKLSPKHRAALSLAGERLSRARQQPHIGDAALDGAIALEAIFLNDSQEELSYRLSLRAALLLGTNEADRVEIFTKIKKFYGVRSEIAHGALTPQKAAAKGGDVIKFVLELTGRAGCEILKRRAIPSWNELELRLGGDLPASADAKA